MSDVAICVANLSKSYRIGLREPYKALRDSMADAISAPFRAIASLRNSRQTSSSQPPPSRFIWALKDVSFDVKGGEVVGIIGPNGAGKSTLLKILSRITEPTEGYAEVRGRVGTLLEVGTGFHPELTGRENIYLSGAILGMKKVEIERRFDAIVSFAEVEKFTDTPVKHYSSGMHVRLAFAVAAHLEPEILMVDEVLAVGDAAFQKKCLGKVGDVASEGRTVLFVSHNMGAIQKLCPRSILLESGRVLMGGSTSKVIEAYLQNVQLPSRSELGARRDRKGNGLLRFTAISITGRLNGGSSAVTCGEDLEACLAYTLREPIPDQARMLVAIGVNDMYGDCLFLCSNDLTDEISQAWPQSGEVRCRVRHLPLVAGLYKVNVYAAINGEVADWVVDAATFEVESSDFFGSGRLPPASHGRFLVPHSWSLEKNSVFASWERED